MATASTILSIVLGVISVTLGAFAVWLSAVFYRFGNETSENMREITSRVERAVGVLDAHVEGLHSDTFTLMNETVREMRSALWSRMETAQDDLRAQSYSDLEAKLVSLRQALVHEISGILKVEQPDRPALDDAVDIALRKTAQVGITEQLAAAKTAIKARLDRPDAGFGVPAAALMTSVAQNYPFSIVVLAINQMRRDRELNWSGVELRPTTTVLLSRKDDV